MIEPTLNYVPCPGLAATSPAESNGHRMAYWEWNDTGNPAHPHVLICVHGLSRQGRDFDVFARRMSRHTRVICPDVVGRGMSDWLADPQGYQIPTYVGDMVALIHHLHAEHPITRLDWVGTSMGGLIGLVVSGAKELSLPVPVHSLVLNDVGPAVQWEALQRIGSYLGRPLRFDSVEAAADEMRKISAGFGAHSTEEWLALSRPMVARAGHGRLRLHYDPGIAAPLRKMTQQAAEEGEAFLWKLYEQITARTLLLRGAQSDLLSPATAERMTQVGPRARLAVFEFVGHAPTLVADDQGSVVERFLCGSE
ncbi:alpha/beta fold hydrolase [Diaphorobacter aerolatus]|uniref:Alpha/beta hydrolase n=1 Tax=Diaphorobacter aerolatus TaxID=1288495 RepID=A0A7H0GJ81_9BURK|nr:alpha/beta hydrolase [Diaphorobacter aerolatus]QNP48347.1 alpha/beta hydrolase [Diaphorobacter aerolatus]